MFVNWIKIRYLSDIYTKLSDIYLIFIWYLYKSDIYLIYKFSPSARVCIPDKDRLLMFYLVLINSTCLEYTTVLNYTFWTSCQQVVTMLLFYQVATRLSLTTCWQIDELQGDNKLLEQLVTSLKAVNNKQWTSSASVFTCVYLDDQVLWKFTCTPR
jgi:hypothetical protein